MNNPIYTSHTRFTPIIILTLLVAIVSISAGAIIPSINNLPWTAAEMLSLVLVFIVAIAPLLLALYRNTLDIFEPVYLISFATIVSFVLAPMLLLASGDIIDTGISYRSEAVPAILMSGFALLSFYLGYYRAQRYWQMHPPKASATLYLSIFNGKIISNWAFVGLAIAGAFFSWWLLANNLSLSALNSLAENNYYRAAIQEAQNNIVYLYLTHVSWIPLFLLAFPTTFRSNSRRMWLTLLWIMVLSLYIASGSRGVSFRLLVATAVFFYLIRRKRPSLRLILVSVVTLTILAGSLVILRSKQYSNISISDLNSDIILEAAKRDLTEGGAATGLMIIQRVFPEKAGYLYLQIFEELIYAPIPRVLWPGKPAVRGVLTVAEQYVPDSHAPPFWAPYYAGFGLPGTAVSMIILGIISAWIFSIWLHAPQNLISCTLLAIWLALLWELYHRGGIAWSVVNSIYMIGPIVLVTILARGFHARFASSKQLKEQGIYHA